MILKLGMKHQAMELYKVYINHDPEMTLTYFMARSTKVPYAFKWDRLLKYDLKGKTCMNWRFKILKRIWTSGVGLPLPQGIIHIHVYNHNIQRSSSLKPLGQSVKFHRKHLYEGGTNLIINKPGHMTKMVAMPIYGKNLQKFSSLKLLNLLQLKLICRHLSTITV